MRRGAITAHTPTRHNKQTHTDAHTALGHNINMTTRAQTHLQQVGSGQHGRQPVLQRRVDLQRGDAAIFITSRGRRRRGEEELSKHTTIVQHRTMARQSTPAKKPETTLPQRNQHRRAARAARAGRAARVARAVTLRTNSAGSSEKSRMSASLRHSVGNTTAAAAGRREAVVIFILCTKGREEGGERRGWRQRGG